MVAYLKRLHDVHIVVVDNASSYPPLLDWLAATDVEVVRLKENVGYRCVWKRGLIPLGSDHRKRFGTDWYVVSDPDLDISSCPLDCVQVLAEGLSRRPRYVKVGLSLEIQDLPDHYAHKQSVLVWERGHWLPGKRVDGTFFHSAIDTTFAVYHCDRPYQEDAWIAPSLRADRPYTARHLPWYCDLDNLDEEELFFLRSLQTKTHWSGLNRNVALHKN